MRTQTKARAAQAEIQGIFSPLQPADLVARRLRTGMVVFDADLGFQKRCPRCDTHWPMDTEFWFPCKGAPDGLTSWCRACYCAWRWPNGRATERRTSGQAAMLIKFIDADGVKFLDGDVLRQGGTDAG
jgi:hypothetical protein